MAEDLCQAPAGIAPDGQRRNFDDPTSLAPVTMTVIAIMVTWGAVFTIVRFYMNIRKLKLGDYFALIALVLSIIILGLMSTQMRTARHIWDIPACYFDALYAQGVFFPAFLLSLGNFFAKASIFLLFYQIFTIKRSMRYAIWLGQVFNFLLYGSGLAVAVYYETPRPGESWTDTLDGRAIKPLKYWQVQSALAVVLDIYIFILPLRPLCKLNISIQRRISVLTVFSLALMGIGASIASLVERIMIVNSADVTWISTILGLCSSVELNVAIIVSSAPGFASFTRSYVPKLSVIASGFVSTRTKTRDPESVLVGPESKYTNSNKSKCTGSSKNPAQDRTGPYYELNDTWIFESRMTVEKSHTEFGNQEIMRTVAVEQEVRTRSTESLMK